MESPGGGGGGGGVSPVGPPPPAVFFQDDAGAGGGQGIAGGEQQQQQQQQYCQQQVRVARGLQPDVLGTLLQKPTDFPRVFFVELGSNITLDFTLDLLRET